MPKQPGQSAAQKRIARTEAYAASIGRMFDETVSDILKLKLAKPTEEGVMYSFDGDTMQVRKKVEALLKRLHGAATLAIAKGVEKEWNIANQECDDLVKNIFGKKLFESDRFRAWTAHNEGAMNAFINRSDKGMNLSDRVWKSARQLRDEMEVALTVGMAEGDSAAGLSRQVRQCLNDPDLMFRRFRYKKGEDENGNPIWGRKWKKKIIEDGKTKWIDYDKDSYIPKGAGDHSRGVYKSAAKNAMRVARTETNMAYRRSDYERWQQMSFILGIRIEMSNQHPKPDICDEMQGDYPKNFYFSGWHPMCYTNDTKVLTDEGWKLFADVRGDELILSLNPETRETEWVKITDGQCWRNDGAMRHFRNKSLDCLVTPEHRMVYLNKSDGRIEYTTADDYRKTKGAFYRGCLNSNPDRDTIAVCGKVVNFDWFCEFMGYYLSDGSTVRKSQIIIAQKDGETSKATVRQCLEKAGYRVTSRQYTLEFYDTELCTYLKQFGLYYEKYVPSEILNASQRQIRIFLDAYSICDGYRRKAKDFQGSHGHTFHSDKEEIVYFTTSNKMAGNLSELILKVGCRPSFKIQQPQTTRKKDGSLIAGKFPCFRISECKAVTATVFTDETVEYHGNVYDLTLEKNHIMYVARNGKCFWGSNCFCYATPILVSEDEMAKVNSEFLQGRTYQPQGQPVLDTPPNFKQWIKDNRERILDANSLPYWIKDNPMFVDAKKGAALTPDPAKIEALFPKNTATKNHELLDKAKAAMPEEGSEALNKRFASLQDAVNGDMGEEEVQRLYDRVIAGIETQKKWDALVWDGFEEGQRKALEEFGKAIGMKKGRPMTHMQADTGKVNPLYQPKFIKDKYGFWQRNPKYKKGYTINCQTCAPVYALRRMGFNIEAGEYTKKIPSFEYLAQNYRQAWKWRDPRNYKSTHKPSDMFNAANAEKDSVWQVQCVWKGGRSAHTFNLVNDNGKTFFYDPQTNKRFNTLEEFREYSDKVSPTYGFQYFRIDKKWVNSTWLSKNVLAAQTRMTPEEIRHQEIMNKARKRHEARPADYREKLLERRAVTQEADRLLKKAEDFAWNQGIADKGDTLRHVRFAKDTDVEKIKKNIDGLKKRIDKQKQIITNTSKNLDKLATKYEYSQDIKDKVEAMQNASTYTEMRQKQRELAKAISAEVKDNRILSEIIPDVEKWKKQFTSEELHGAFDAVKKKLDSIQYESLENQKKQLEKEMMWCSNANYLKPHKLHSTSPVAEAAYTKQLQKVEIQIKTNELKAELTSLKTPLAKTFKSLNDELDDIDTLINEGKLAEAEKKIASAKQTKIVVDKYEALSSYHTPKFDAMLAEAKDLLDKGDMASASVKLSEAEKIKTKNEQSKASKAKKAESKKNLEAEIKEATDLAWDDIQKQFLDGKVKFKLGIDKKIDAALASGDFKKAQKLLKDNFNIDVLDENNQYREAARKAGTAQGSVKFDNSCFTQQRRNSAKWCKTAKEGNDFFFDEDSVDQWIGFYEDQKDALYRYTSGSSYLTEPLRAIKGHYYAYDGRPIAQDIENATAALNKCALKKDAWVKRDDNPWCVEYAFGIPDLNAYKTDPSKLVGMTGIDRSFMSCATAKESYFGTKEVVYNIYCPKGTKGIYAETFSAFGKQKRNFDGKTKPTGVDKYNENEFLLQRGAIMRITKAEYNVNDGKWYIDVEVLGHKIEDYELKKGSGGWYCDFK